MELPKVPLKLSELTPEWLTQALRANGAITEARVIEVKREPLGEGEGFLGQLERLHLSYDVALPGAGAPATVIAKLPSLVAKNRVMAELLGAYEREILFYRELAPKLPCRMPRVYYGEMDHNPLSKHAPKIIAWLDRRPSWVIGLVMLLTMLMVRVSRRGYALLMEDLAPAEVGDQVAGASPERCRDALVELAALHAALWQSPELDAHYWLARQDIAIHSIGLLYRRSRPRFADRFLAQHPELGPYLDWLDENADELARCFHGTSPHSLLHMDYRLDNLFFGEPAGKPAENSGDDPGITVVDWQVVGRGPGIYDVAYFIMGSLAPEVGGDVEAELVVAYHQALVAGGVADYPLERCQFDYQRALMLNLHRLASADMVEFGDGRGALLIECWVERLSARITQVDVGKLL